MTTRFLSLLLISALALASAGVRAERADRDKPMNIEADALRHDELKQVSVFTGNVVMTKGTIVLRGSQLDVRQDADGFQYGVVTAAPGKRAFFRQKRDSAPGMPNEYVEGEGEVIEYDGKADIVKFIRRSELRRFRDTTLTDEVKGALIVYNNVTDVFTVDGAVKSATPGSQPSKPGERVKMILTPKTKPVEGAASPATERQSPAPALRPSTDLNGGSK